MSPDVTFLNAQQYRLSGPTKPVAIAHEFFEAFLSDPPTRPSSLVDNVSTQPSLVRLGDELLPMTSNTDNLDDSWVCSPYNAVVTYPLEELRIIQSVTLRTALAGLVHAIGPVMRFGRINRVVTVNNWLLSTNLYPEIRHDSLKTLTEMISDRYPRQAILFRSLNYRTNQALIESLKSLGYLLVPSRQVYLFDGRLPDYLQRHNTKIDLQRLERSKDFVPVPHEQFLPDQDTHIRELYDMLYLRKYSVHNPHFTEQLISIWRQSKLVKLFGLKNRDDQLAGVVGTFAMHGVLTAPLVGYDTTLPQSSGLYRMLMAHVLRTAADERLMLNLSAGAAGFKRLRGGVPEIEYSAVFCWHLPLRQRSVWKSLAAVLEHVGARVLRKYEL